MSAQRAGEAVDKRRSGGGSEEDLSLLEMEEYATEAEKKSLVDRQVRLSSSYFDMLHCTTPTDRRRILPAAIVFPCYMVVVNSAGIFSAVF